MNIPETLLSSLDGLPGYDRAAFAEVHREGRVVTSIRLNPAKVTGLDPGRSSGEAPGLSSHAGGATAARVLAALCESGSPERVPWSSFGYYLPERPPFTFDPVLHAGGYYVQEASSMFVEEAMRQTVDLSASLRVLDLCAAPGGKSTLLQSILSPDSLLVSNEVIRNRVHVLQENIVKWGAVNRVVISNDPYDLGQIAGFFDVIVVDAPCSGSGLIRRDPAAVREWSPDSVRLCHQRQQRILADCWPALRKGGMLIYSTCSYSREENEDIVDWLTGELDAVSLRLRIPEEWKIMETEGRGGGYGYRFYPHRLRGEGFFLACLRKNGGGEYIGSRKREQVDRLGKKDEALVSAWTRAEFDLAYFRNGDFVHGIPARLLPGLAPLQQACHVRIAGVTLGRSAGVEFIPEHDLALSVASAPSLPALSLSREEALQYLRKEDLATQPLQRGWMLIRYEGLNLGWIKALPGRINNYYPKEWRILRREP